jgi:hypothetical protein
MSASPETDSVRPADEIVTLLSGWLAFHVSNPELRQRLLGIGTDGLSVEQTEAILELTNALADAAPDARGDLEMLVRETLEAVALG